MTNVPARALQRDGFLGWVERVGNALPDPVLLFVYLVIALVVVSVVASATGWSAIHPTTGESVNAVSLLSAANLRRLVVDMPSTFTHFHPLGYVLVVMLGAGVAERTGLLAAALRAAVRRAPRSWLTPAVAFVSMMGNLAADAAFVVLIPLAGVLYASAGRHPIAGIVASFAAVSGGFSANLLPGQLDALLFGITETAAEILDPSWDANIAGNWYFMAVLLFIDLPIVWAVTDRLIEPRLGAWSAPAASSGSAQDGAAATLSPLEQRGLVRAAIAAGAVVVIWSALVLAPGAPLLDATAKPEVQLTPFYRSLVAGFFVLFLAAGCAYGSVTGAIRHHRDAVRMMSESMQDMGYYLVLAFTAAHFVSLFQWSNLALLMAIDGASALKASGLPAPGLAAGVVILTAVGNLFVGSASAKWALLAPVLVPMLMLLDLSPEMTTAAYRVGDSATNIITPLMVYFPLVLTFCQRWKPDYGLGSLLAAMIPYSCWILVAGVILTVAWVLFDLPLGPGGARVGYTLLGR
ncbi:MAG: AbgT family transporter [Planctomycetota bacterium]